MASNNGTSVRFDILERDDRFDILERDDRSHAPIPKNAGAVPKRTKYPTWSNGPGPMGEYALVDKGDLHIDGRYQREEISKQKVLDIARTWDWRLFGAVSVARRPDGSLWVYDGGHRTRASFYRDDVLRLPCLIFDAERVEDEAEAFDKKNQMRHAMRAHHKHRARVMYGDATAVRVEEIMAKHGYSAASGGEQRYGVRAVGTLTSIVKRDADMAERVFDACVDIGDSGEQPPSAVMKGLFVLAKKVQEQDDVLSGIWMEKLKDAGLPGLGRIIYQHKTAVGHGGEKVYASAIMQYLNKNQRTRRLRWDD